MTYLQNNGQVALGMMSGTTFTVAHRFAPKSIKVNGESVASSDSGRTSKGVMIIQYIKTNLRKIEIELPAYKLSDGTYNDILNYIQGKTFYMAFYDPYTHSEKVRHFYCSSSASEFYNGVIYNGIVQGCTFTAIDMGDYE